MNVEELTRDQLTEAKGAMVVDSINAGGNRYNNGKPVYVVTMALYSENDRYLHTEAVGVFCDEEDANYKLECALTDFINEVCDAHPEILPEDTDPVDENGQTIMDFSSVNGEKAAFRVERFR